MEGRCAVETWTEFGCLGTLNTPNIKHGFGTDVFVCTGSEEVYIFSVHERKLKAVLQLPGPVSDLVESHDKQLIFVACSSGIYCVSLHSLLARSQGSSACASTSPEVLKVSSEFLLVGTDGASALLLIGSVLLTLCQRDGSWLLTLHETSQQMPFKHNTSEVLRSFSLPVVTPALQGIAESKTRLTRTPVLVCVHFGDVTQTDATSAHAHFQLEPALFKLLFGVEAALAKSPVILCGLPDGRLCFLPLRLPGSRLRVFYNLEQPVVFVGASVVMGTAQGPAQCLVAVGGHGRMVLIKTDKGGPERGGIVAGFTEGCVSGPVRCVCVDKNSVYYSTGSDLFKLNLSEGSPGRGSKEEDQGAFRTPAATFQSPCSLNVCRVIALAEPTCNGAGEIELLGLSVRGQLQRISIPVRRQDEGLSKLPSSQVGRNVRDLLSAIGDVCERASVLETTIKSKNQMLKRLNQVLNISFLLTASTNTKEPPPVQEKPIKCHATASWSRLLQKDSLTLTCVLDNSSPYVLEQGWTLCIAVSPLSHSSTTGKETSSSNFSFSFHNLYPRERLEVSLPVASAGETSFPLTVNCSLMFSLSTLLGEEELAAFPDLQSCCFSLPLNTLTVDWLHTLRAVRPTPAHQMATSQPSSITGYGLQAVLNSHLFRCSRGMDRGGEGGPKPESYSASVRVSSELLRDTLMSKSFDLDPKGPELAHRNLCLTLLDWLLSGGAGGVNMEQKGDKFDLSSSVVHARCPNEATVKLTAKEVNVGEESTAKEDPSMGIEVHIESSSIAAVCGLHHALLCRIQTLLQRAPEEAASTKGVQNLGLTQALQRARMQHSQITQALSVGRSSQQMDRLLLEVYRELRGNPLLII